MAGYNWKHGKSNNAVAAESEGLMVASKLAAWIRGHRWNRFAGITAADVAHAMDDAEWHHSSKFYNKVYYYDPTDLAEQDVRDALAVEIAKRRRYQTLVKQAREAGMTCFLTDKGNETVTIPTRWRLGRHAANELHLEMIERQMSVGFAGRE